MRLTKTILIISLYFIGVLFIPWETLSFGSSISSAYLWDIGFILYFIFTTKVKLEIFFKQTRSFFKRVIFTFLFALFCTSIIYIFNLKTPFSLIEHNIIQLMVLAPVIEELLFRFSFFHKFKKSGFSKRKAVLVSSLLFSLSHGLALKILPSEFSNFIYFQMTYTFVLGLIASKSLLVHKSIFAPIVLHGVFNGVFALFANMGLL